jgi:hypothetical protein
MFSEKEKAQELPKKAQGVIRATAVLCSVPRALPGQHFQLLKTGLPQGALEVALQPETDGAV